MAKVVNMQKKIGKLIVFAVGFLFLAQEIREAAGIKNNLYLDDWILPYLGVLVAMAIFAFLEVKTAVLGIFLNLLVGIYLIQSYEKKILFACLLAGIVTYYENISELKPLGYRKNHGTR